MNVASTQAIVLGASAGAVDALSTILPALRAGFPLPMIVVVHLPPDKNNVIPELLRVRCRINVREAEDKEPIQPGTVYFAPPDYHLLVETNRRLSLSSEEPVHFSRPSIDVLFETAADAYASELIGIILTGANSDGARGLRAVYEAGGIALVQRPELAYSPVMPQAALDACPGALALGLEEIAAYLMEVVSGK